MVSTSWATEPKLPGRMACWLRSRRLALAGEQVAGVGWVEGATECARNRALAVNPNLGSAEGPDVRREVVH
jgi:hypothetical protein